MKVPHDGLSRFSPTGANSGPAILEDENAPADTALSQHSHQRPKDDLFAETVFQQSGEPRRRNWVGAVDPGAEVKLYAATGPI